MSGNTRVCHCIKPNKTSPQPRYVLFWDTESWIESNFSAADHRFRLGWTALRRQRDNGKPTYEWTFLDTPETFWHVLNSFGDANRRVWCLAHNIAYDLWMVGGLDAVYAHGYEVVNFYQGGPTTILRIKRDRRTVLFLDTLNWFPGSVAEWGAATGLPKLDTDTQDPDDEKVSVYCHRDVEILTRVFDAWAHLVAKHDLGSLALSVGGQAFNAYRHKYMEHKIYIHADEATLTLERDAYYGGRAECWWIGHLPPGRYTLLDVHSMYPYVMRDRSYPARLRHHYRKITLSDLADVTDRWGVIARVRVKIDAPVAPVKKDFHTFFPVGTFWANLTGPEIELCQQHGEILDVSEVSLYDMEPLFRNYVAELYRLRQGYRRRGKDLYANLVKKLLNTLYGKWGQKRSVWNKRANKEGRTPGWYLEHYADKPGTFYSLCLGPEIFDLVEVTESPSSFPAIAAYVTAYARCVLWSYIEKAGYEHVYYMDTDSLLVDDAGLENLAGVIHPSRLGRLGIELQADKAEIRSPKDYQIGDRHKIKGLTRNARQVSDTDYDDLQWPKLRGLLEEGRTSGYANTIVRKQLRRNYCKGDVLPSGQVKPWVYAEGETQGGELPF